MSKEVATMMPDEAGKKINRLHLEAHAHAETAVKKAILCGKELEKQKELLSHGKWLPWVEENLTFDERTARRYLQVAANRTRVSDSTSIREAVKLLAEPKEITEETKAPVAPSFDMEGLRAELVASFGERFADLESKIADVDQLDEQLKKANAELKDLRKLEGDRDKVETALKEIHELEKKKLELFKDAESTKLIQQVLIRSREFFTRECMQIPALKLRPESVKVMRQDFEGLVELVDNWLTAVKERFL